MKAISTAVTSAWPLLFNDAKCGNGGGYRQTTVVSFIYEGRESVPVEATELKELSLLPSQSAALDWMLLAKEGLPNATPLTPEERVSINEFFCGPTSNEPTG
jgi:hypothetical protein